MRQIKFRAWDTKYKKMIFTGFHLLGEVMAFGEIEEYCMKTKGDNGSIGRWNDIEIMQYTGLKDKNGKEIYEGDWCEAEFRDRKGIQVIQGQIIMDDYMWCIDCRGCVGDDIFSINRPYNFEIIGNIYENPELLKQ